MKSFDSRLEVLEALRAKRRIHKSTKMERDLAVKQALSGTPEEREEKLQAALQACRDDNQTGHGALTQEQREAAVKAAFRADT
jgi:hypothetical protein